MPGFRDLQPTVVDINSLQNTEVHQNKLWDLAETSGLHQGSNLNNMLAFADGSSVFTGYFSETVQFGGKTISSNSKNNVCFIAKTKSTGEIIWNNSLESTANAVGLAVAHDKQGNVFLAGSFSGNLEVANQILSIPKGKTDVFVACYGNTGTLKWIKKAGLDSLPQDISMAFSIEFTSAGMRKSFVLSEAYPDFQNYGLSAGNDGTIIYSGISSQVIASVETPNIAYASSMDLNIPELLKLENDRLLKQQTDKSIAGLIAAINLVKNSGIDISGLYARQALDKYNPGFKKNCPNLYKNLGKIKFVKNNRGIITMLTENGEDVLFDKIKVKDKSTLTISTNGNGDIQMDILSGIKVGKMVVWYPLNSIHVYKNSGDLLFDYDTDHSQQKLSMRKDILK
jgi:hypothetical protein